MAFLRIHAPWLRLPRPKTLLGFIPLQMGTELISLMLFFNKLTGFYGLLAILTGFSLSAIQLSAYLYNLIVLVLLAICIPHIKLETPLPNLVLAWVYAVDTAANAAYTAVFAASWYLTMSAETKEGAVASTTGAGTVATSTSSSTTLATVAPPRTTMIMMSHRQEAATAISSTLTAAVTTASTVVASSVTEATPTDTATAGSGGFFGAHEMAASMTVIVAVTMVRIYFGLVVMAYARRALQRYGERVTDQGPKRDDGLNDDSTDSDKEEGSGGTPRGDTADDDIADEEAGLKSGTRSSRGRRHRRRGRGHRYNFSSSSNEHNPFAEGAPAGEGWRGKVGRALVAVGRGYWLDRAQDDDWTREFGAKFRTPIAA